MYQRLGKRAGFFGSERITGYYNQDSTSKVINMSRLCGKLKTHREIYLSQRLVERFVLKAEVL
jgi:hypothetical protein